MNKFVKYILFPFQFIWTFIIYHYYCRKYRDVDYFDYKTLANPKFVEPKGFNSVCHYGTYKCVAQLTGRRFNFITDYLEHSANFMTEPEIMRKLGYYNRPTIRKIYAMSNLNVATYNECIQKESLRSQAIAVGPYINGADFFYTKSKLDAIKQKYCRILLVFPQHSIENIHSDFDKETFINAIHEIKNAHTFDTVFICLYWADILKKMDKIYLENGFTVVTSGHRSDSRFLCRQKDLIYLADYTMSNAIGAYIGYSVIMGKPHFMYRQSTQYLHNNAKTFTTSPSFEAAKITFQQIFGVFTAQITQDQKALVEKYWGK
jgi:hypothetical protein